MGYFFARPHSVPPVANTAVRQNPQPAFEQSLATSQLYTQNKSSLRAFVSDVRPVFNKHKYQTKFTQEAARSADYANRFVARHGREKSGILVQNHKQALSYINRDVREGALSPKQALKALSNLHKEYRPHYQDQSNAAFTPLKKPDFSEEFGTNFLKDAPADQWMGQKKFDALYRVDDRPHAEIFETGFTPREPLERPTLQNIKEHVEFFGKGVHKNFVSQTKSKDMAESKQFFTDFSADNADVQQQYYVIRNSTGWDTQDFPNISDNSVFHSNAWEQEIIAERVPASQIEKVVIRYKDGNKAEIKNPNARF